MKNLMFIFILSLLLINCYGNKSSIVKAKIKDKIYKFELAITTEERKKGLMFRNELDKNSGMLFVYPKEYSLSFYMKNTLIPLDIAFIDSNYKIIDIRQMQPLDETPVNSKADAQYALEVNLGFFSKIGIKEGDTIEFLSAIPYVVE